MVHPCPYTPPSLTPSIHILAHPSTPRAAITALCTVPHTTYLVVASADGSATLYDFSNQSVCGRWTNFTDMPTTCAAFYTSIVTAEMAGNKQTQAQAQAQHHANGGGSEGKDAGAGAPTAVAASSSASPTKPPTGNNNNNGSSNSNNSPTRSSPTNIKTSPTSAPHPHPTTPGGPSNPLLAVTDAKDGPGKGGNTDGGKEAKPEEEEEEEEAPNILVRGHNTSLRQCWCCCFRSCFR